MNIKKKRRYCYILLSIIIIISLYISKAYIFWIATVLTLFLAIKQYLDNLKKPKNTIIKNLKNISPLFVFIISIAVISLNIGDNFMKNNEADAQSRLIKSLNDSDQKQSKLIESLNYSNQDTINHMTPFYTDHIEKKIPEIIILANRGECDEIANYTSNPLISAVLKKTIRIHYSFCNLKKGNLEEAIMILKKEREYDSNDFITNLYLYYYNIIKLNNVTNSTFPYLREYNREIISQAEIKEIDTILDENAIYINSLIQGIDNDNKSLDMVLFRFEDKPVTIRQLLMNLNNIQAIPEKDDADFLDFIKKMSIDNKVQFHISLCKYSFTEKEICKFNPADIGMSCSNESYIINEDACWRVLDRINTTTDDPIFDNIYKENQIEDILKNLAYHHFIKCTGFNYRELSRKHDAIDFNIKNESECDIAINILNSNDDLYYIRDNILEMLYEHHFNKCTNSSIFDIRMKMQNGESFDIPYPAECKLSLHYMDELINKSQGAWRYQSDKDVISSIVIYLESKIQ